MGLNLRSNCRYALSCPAGMGVRITLDDRIDQPCGQFFHTNWTGHGGDTAASTYNA